MVKEEYILDLLKAKKKLFKIANEQKDLDLMIYGNKTYKKPKKGKIPSRHKRGL